jgi:hypothetical protein
MSQSKSTDKQNKQSANLSEEDLAKQRAGVTDKSSHNNKANTKAGSDAGAGGGAKQKQRR